MTGLRFLAAATPWAEAADPGELRRLADAIGLVLGAETPVVDAMPNHIAQGTVVLADLGTNPLVRLAGIPDSVRRHILPIGVMRSELGELAHRFAPIAAIEFDSLRRWLNGRPGAFYIFGPVTADSPFEVFHGPQGSAYALLQDGTKSLPQLTVDFVRWRCSKHFGSGVLPDPSS